MNPDDFAQAFAWLPFVIFAAGSLASSAISARGTSRALKVSSQNQERQTKRLNELSKQVRERVQKYEPKTRDKAGAQQRRAVGGRYADILRKGVEISPGQGRIDIFSGPYQRALSQTDSASLQRAAKRSSLAASIDAQKRLREDEAYKNSRLADVIRVAQDKAQGDTRVSGLQAQAAAQPTALETLGKTAALIAQVYGGSGIVNTLGGTGAPAPTPDKAAGGGGGVFGGTGVA